jgi:hypothetical protein
MADNPKIRGKTQEEKNASIEHALRSLTRRVMKRATVYIPPVPIFMHCDVVPENNVMAEVLLPFTGTLSDMFVRIGEKKTTRVGIALSVISATGEATQHFVMEKQVERFELNWEVYAGSTLELVLEEGQLSHVLIATAIYPTLEDHKAKQYLLEEILAQEKEEEK